jgi:hypothetical protein
VIVAAKASPIVLQIVGTSKPVDFKYCENGSWDSFNLLPSSERSFVGATFFDVC